MSLVLWNCLEQRIGGVQRGVAAGQGALLGLHGTVPTIVLLLEACPCAAITTMFAIQFHHDEELAAGAVVFSTLSSILTLPLYALLLTMVLG